MKMRELINLLLVDDNSDFLKMIHEMLVEDDLSVKSVETVTEAEKILKDFEVDAIVCDFNLPGSNGIEFLRQIRKGGHNTPFILISGYVTTEVLFDALRLGAFDIIEKPLQFDQLCMTVSQAINYGIQNRLFQERIQAKLSPEDYKLASKRVCLL
jgi:two-component system NtrC family response regulator